MSLLGNQLLLPKHIQILTKDSSSLVNEFIDPADISGTAAVPPADHSTVAGTHHRRLVEDLQHLVTYVKGAEHFQKTKSAHPLLVNSVKVGPKFAKEKN